MNKAMYHYIYDEETDSLLLNDKTSLMSKEPRPIYAQGLDFLGVYTIWDHVKQQELPYMWAECNHYIYKEKNYLTTT